MTKVLLNEQTLPFSSDGANKTQMCALSEEISGFHLITEVQSQVQTPDPAEQSSALGSLPECSTQATRQMQRQL